MTQAYQSTLSNNLLRALSPDDFGLLAPHLKPLTAQLRQILIKPDTPITTLYFVESGFCSITAGSAGSEVEVGLIGREGVVGASSVLLGSERTPYANYIQSPGRLLAIGADVFASAVMSSPTLRDLMLCFVHTLFLQTTETAFANASYKIDVRLARWLLMCQDRLGIDELPLTHEFLAIMLGVQRTSVTLALQSLEGRGLITAKRGRVEIRRRDEIMMMAERGYGLPEAEYERLIGGFPARQKGRRALGADGTRLQEMD